MGASNVRVGLLDGNGALLARRRADIHEKKSDPAATLALARSMAEEVVAEAGLGRPDVGFIGMGFPGTVDDARQTVRFAPNLGWRDVSVGGPFRDFPGAALALVQDARAAAFGEYLLGAGRGEPLVVCITLGTGIGAGIVSDGKLFRGPFNTAGEIGHMIVQDNGLTCACGKSGCLETYSSGTGIVNAAQRRGRWDRAEVATAEAVFRLAAGGDREAGGVIREAARYLGLGIVNVVNLLSPTVVVLSGGMCAQEELLIQPVREFVMARGYSLSVRPERFRVVRAQLGEEAPMIGAGMLYKEG